MIQFGSVDPLLECIAPLVYEGSLAPMQLLVPPFPYKESYCGKSHTLLAVYISTIVCEPKLFLLTNQHTFPTEG